MSAAAEPRGQVDRLVGPSIDQRPVAGLQWIVVAICAAVLFGDGFDAVAMSFAAPAIARALSLQSGAVSLLISAMPLGALVGAFGIAPLGDRFGRKWLLVGAMAVCVVTSLLNAAATSLDQLLVWRVLTGVCLGVMPATAGALAADYAPQRLRGTLVTVMFCGLSLGSIASGLSAAPIVHSFGWPAVFVVGAGLSILVLPIVVLFLPESLSFLVRSGRREQAVVLAARMQVDLESLVDPSAISGGAGFVKPRFSMLLTGPLLPVTLLVWLLMSMVAVAYSLISYWLPTLVTSAGSSFKIAALAGALTHFGGLAGCILYGRSMDRIGPYRTMFGAFGLGTLAVIALASSHVPAAILTTSFLVGVCIEGSIVGTNAFTASVYPSLIRSTGMGWATGAGRLGGVLGPLLVGGLLSLHWSTADIFYSLALPTTMAFLVVGLLYRLRHRTAAAEPSQVR